MTETQEESLLANRLLWVFQQRGAPGLHTMPLEGLANENRLDLLGQLDLDSEELPVIVCFLGTDSWTVQTTRRLIWRDRDGPHEVWNSQIVDATFDLDALSTAGSKSELRNLLVRTRSGDTFSIRLEAGQPFSGFWNVVKSVATPQ